MPAGLRGERAVLRCRDGVRGGDACGVACGVVRWGYGLVDSRRAQRARQQDEHDPVLRQRRYALAPIAFIPDASIPLLPPLVPAESCGRRSAEFKLLHLATCRTLTRSQLALMKSAVLSAIASTVRLRFARTVSGIIDASQMRSPSTP